jgi:tetratricopeptide (TPR) repeat protein
MRSSNAIAAVIRSAGIGRDGDDPSGRAVFDALRRLRDEPRGERLHAIVTRCDLANEPHKSVAGDLAISRRQFYRDLDEARRRVAAFLEERPEARDDRTIGDWKLAATVSLTADGRIEAARKLLPLDAAGSDPAEALAWQSIGRALALQTAGQSAEAAAMLERCIQQFRVREDGAPIGADMRSYCYTSLTFCYLELGRLREAATTHARNPAAVPGAVSTLMRKQYLNIDAMLACEGRSGSARARAICVAFHRFAVEHGFVDDISSSLLLLAGIARFERRYDESERLARESLLIHEALDRPVAPIFSMLTGIAIDRGDGRAGIVLARETRTRAATRSHAWWASHLFEAEATNLLKRPAPALAICAMVERDADGSDERIRSWTSRVRAGSFALQGETINARRAAETALEISGEDGPAYLRLRNLLVAERLTPRRQRADEINDLAALLGRNQQNKTTSSR